MLRWYRWKPGNKTGIFCRLRPIADAVGLLLSAAEPSVWNHNLKLRSSENVFQHHRHTCSEETSVNTIKHFPEQQSFILLKDDEEAGYLKYNVSDGLWNITHTVVNPAFLRQGLARILVDAAIAAAEKRNIRLKADYDYAAAVLAKRQA